MDKRRAAFDLFLISALGLFVELVFIRWAASELRVLAFYKNFALIAAFLGLGLGFAIRRRDAQTRTFERYYFPLLAASVILILLLGRTPLSEFILLNRADSQEFIWAGTMELQNPWVSTLLDVAFYVILLALFLLITILFIPLGELTARKFAPFQPLKGYTVNVLGSLAGILIYTLISFLGWPPSIWFSSPSPFYSLYSGRPAQIAPYGRLITGSTSEPSMPPPIQKYSLATSCRSTRPGTSACGI